MKEKITLKDFSHCKHKYWFYMPDEENYLECDVYCCQCNKHLRHLNHIEP
jgi:hypothetical protein